MNQEKINAQAKKHASASETIFEQYDRENAFKAGVSYAAANPDVIGCVKMEDMCHFIEWAYLSNQFYLVTTEIKGGKILTVWMNYFDKTVSTEDLFQIYQQQKQQG